LKHVGRQDLFLLKILNISCENNIDLTFIID
jgi:hypothetical protein